MDKKSYMKDCYECPFANKENARQDLRAMHFLAGLILILAGIVSLGAFGLKALIAAAVLILPAIYCMWRAIVYYRRT